MNPVFLIQFLVVVVFLVGVLLVAAGKPNWFAKWAQRRNPFFPFRRWNFTSMPPDWKRRLVAHFVYGLLFGCVTIWLSLRYGAGAGGVAAVSGLMCLNFVVVAFRIIAKSRALGERIR